VQNPPLDRFGRILFSAKSRIKSIFVASIKPFLLSFGLKKGNSIRIRRDSAVPKKTQYNSRKVKPEQTCEIAKKCPQVLPFLEIEQSKPSRNLMVSYNLPEKSESAIRLS
jgi:hypothetical protein